jgi:NAD(P)H-hydrate epimerase
MKPLSRDQVRRVDRLAIDELGIPGVVLMENAGRNATDLILGFAQGEDRPHGSAVILCGGGNNGGDGYVIARHLHNRGVAVTILAHKPIDQLAGDAAINARICQRMDLDIRPVPDDPVALLAGADLLIDALLGTGFQGELRPDLLALIEAVNDVRDGDDPPLIVAIDLPSGLDCDTGEPAQTAVQTDLTVTFAAPKPGLNQPAAWPYVRKFIVADIGVPPELVARACL